MSSGSSWEDEALRSSDADLLTVSVEPHGSAIVLSLVGEVDLFTAPRLDAALDEALRGHPRVLVVDLTGVTFLGSVGLTALMAAHQQADEVALRVVATGRVTLAPIQLTGLDSLLNMYPSREAALASE